VDALCPMRHPNVVCFHGLGFWPDEKPCFLVLAQLPKGLKLGVPRPVPYGPQRTAGWRRMMRNWLALKEGEATVDGR
jgi:hypothetical protein